MERTELLIYLLIIVAIVLVMIRFWNKNKE